MCIRDRINDRFGHAVGDQVLQRVAGLLRERVQPGLVARPGGEEFVVVLENVNATRAVTLCEELRLMVAHHPWHGIADGLTVTLSAGIACYPHVAAAELLEQADLQMYRAKRMGRNRVSVVP
ncbi:MAG: GGDEF domain-containing protein, partial [Anaerolineae bacterium]|nr:GGDEF domain-containing protein [Anaerolineae bacterium]